MLTPGSLLSSDVTRLHQAHDVDVVGAIVATQVAAPALRATGGGTILFTGGGWADHPGPAWGTVSLGKAALAAGTEQAVHVGGGEGRRHTAAVVEIRRADEVRLVGGLGGEAADHLEVVRSGQLLQDREIHCPGWVSGGDEGAEDLLTRLDGTVARALSGGIGPTAGQGGPEVDVRNRTPLVRVHPFSILKRRGVPREAPGGLDPILREPR